MVKIREQLLSIVCPTSGRSQVNFKKFVHSNGNILHQRTSVDCELVAGLLLEDDISVLTAPRSSLSSFCSLWKILASLLGGSVSDDQEETILSSLVAARLVSPDWNINLEDALFPLICCHCFVFKIEHRGKRVSVFMINAIRTRRLCYCM